MGCSGNEPAFQLLFIGFFCFVCGVVTGGIVVNNSYKKLEDEDDGRRPF